MECKKKKKHKKVHILFKMYSSLSRNVFKATEKVHTWSQTELKKLPLAIYGREMQRTDSLIYE